MSEPGTFDLFDPAVVAAHDDARDLWQKLLPPPVLRDIDAGLYELQLDLSPAETMARWHIAHIWADQDPEAAWAQRNAEDHLRRVRPDAMAEFDQRVAAGADPVEALRAALRVPGDARYFTQSEAHALIGRRFQATGGYSGVPAGSVGLITGIYPVDRHEHQFGVDITWHGIPGGSPQDAARGGLTDGFSRADLFLVFRAGPNRGRRAMVPLAAPDDGPWFVEALRTFPSQSGGDDIGGSVDHSGPSNPSSQPQGPIAAGPADGRDSMDEEPHYELRWPRRVQEQSGPGAGL